ncbi:uncharacterized protein PG986_011950 [Apiospora aurea]|uniref:Rhodopsin domain-containing protein n=1 Tax=Apiospora aurea TaxID=335848 RepID=A0ABR1PYL0_9PEZI
MSESTPFQREAWTEYATGVVALFLRYFARWRAVGFKQWQGDDVFAVLSLVFWTTFSPSIPGENGTNIGITDEIGARMSPEQIEVLAAGSKYLLAGWCFYVTLIWCLKGTMLCFFHHYGDGADLEALGEGLRLQRFVKLLGLLCVLAYIVMLAVILGHCQPIRKNWQVYPNPGDSCTLAVANYLTLVVLNVRYASSFSCVLQPIWPTIVSLFGRVANAGVCSTDALIVATPIPLLWKVKLTSGRKVAVGLLLCSGIFIMIATILRCVMSLHDIQGINVSTIWAIRETFIGIIAVNAAAIKPLFSQSKWMRSTLMRSKDGLSSSQSGGSRSAARTYFPSRRGNTSSSNDGGYAATAAAASLTHPMTAFGGGHWSAQGRGKKIDGDGDMAHSATHNSSEEMIVPPDFEVTEITPDVERGMGAADRSQRHQQQQDHQRGGRQSGGGRGGIMVTTTYHVE